MVDLVCVDPERVREFWPYAGPMIRQATRQLSLYEQIERSVLTGDQLLWLAWDGAIKSAATTHLADHVCTVTACSGDDMERWLPCFAGIQKYAESEGCRVRIQGRPGWKRALAKAGIDVGSIVFVEREA